MFARSATDTLQPPTSEAQPVEVSAPGFRAFRPSTLASRRAERPVAPSAARLVSLGSREVWLEGTGPMGHGGQRQGGRLEEVESIVDVDHPTTVFHRYRSDPGQLHPVMRRTDEGDKVTPLPAVSGRAHLTSGAFLPSPAASEARPASEVDW